MDTKLTKDSDFLICILYSEYKNRLKNGVSKSKANVFKDISEIKNLAKIKWSEQDTFEICCQLKRAKLLNAVAYDNTLLKSFFLP